MQRKPSQQNKDLSLVLANTGWHVLFIREVQSVIRLKGNYFLHIGPNLFDCHIKNKVKTKVIDLWG